MNRSCKVNGCSEIYHGKEFCKNHYLAFKRHGNPLIKTKMAKGYWAGMECKVNDCVRPVSTMGICSMHYSRDFRLKQKGLPLRYRDE
jgi:hypothetical protein